MRYFHPIYRILNCAPGGAPLPVDYRAVIRIEARLVRPGLADLGHQLVLVDGNSKAGLRRQSAVSVLDGWQGFGEQVVFGVTPLLDEEVRDRCGQLKARRQGNRPVRVM